MDYEKKYKEALERAKQFSEKPYLEDSKGIVEYIFPELKESEDEKIRKEIISALKYANYKGVYDKHLAWLEKQGEHDVYKESFNDGYKLGYREASENIQEEPEKYGLCKIEKQGEQKPAWSEEDEQYLLVCKNALAKYQVSDKWDAIIISRWLEDKLKSLRPQNTWKPSDEQIKALNYVVNLMASSERPTENDLYYNILKSLRQQLKKLREK